jgi:hypothetical protein
MRIRKRLIASTNELVLRNTSSLHWAILQSLNDTFRKAGSQFQERLDEAIGTTRAVIDATLERGRVRSVDVEAEIARLDILRAGLLACRDTLGATRYVEGGHAPDAIDVSLCGASQLRPRSG